MKEEGCVGWYREREYKWEVLGLKPPSYTKKKEIEIKSSILIRTKL